MLRLQSGPHIAHDRNRLALWPAVRHEPQSGQESEGFVGREPNLHAAPRGRGAEERKGAAIGGPRKLEARDRLQAGALPWFAAPGSVSVSSAPASEKWPLRLDCVCIRAFGAQVGFQYAGVKGLLGFFLSACGYSVIFGPRGYGRPRRALGAPNFPVRLELFPVRHNYFPVTILREFVRNALNLMVDFVSISARRGLFLKNSLFFSLLAGNSTVGDRFRGTASATRKSAQIDVIS